jgi:hypothetical protein
MLAGSRLTRQEVTVKQTAISIALAAVMLAVAAPGHAQQRDRRPSKAGTIVKWTLIGAGIGTVAGFSIGFRTYDQAVYAEKYIAQATLAGAGLGAVGGWAIGNVRARAARTSPSARPSLWTPSSPMRRPKGAPENWRIGELVNW